MRDCFFILHLFYTGQSDFSPWLHALACTASENEISHHLWIRFRIHCDSFSEHYLIFWSGLYFIFYLKGVVAPLLFVVWKWCPCLGDLLSMFIFLTLEKLVFPLRHKMSLQFTVKVSSGWSHRQITGKALPEEGFSAESINNERREVIWIVFNKLLKPHKVIKCLMIFFCIES